MPVEIRTVALHVSGPGDPIFAEGATTVRVEDQGAGEYVAVLQDGGSIKIEPHEWPVLRDAIDRMVAECRP